MATWPFADHDPLDGTNVLAIGIIDSSAFNLVTADEVNGFPRLSCHGIPPHFWPVTALKHIHRTGMP